MRLRPDLGLYRRAMVNLLISTIVAEDKAKYAKEALDLFELLRLEQQVDDQTLDKELAETEKLARDILAANQGSEEEAVVKNLGSMTLKESEGLQIDGYLDDEYLSKAKSANAESEGTEETDITAHVAAKPGMQEPSITTHQLTLAGTELTPDSSFD